MSAAPVLQAANLRAVAPDVCVAGQLTPAAMAEAASAGFRSIVNKLERSVERSVARTSYRS